MQKVARKSSKGEAQPELRLTTALIGSIFLPISLFWYAWAAHRNVHWAAVVMAGIPLGFGSFCIFVSKPLRSLTYVSRTDCGSRFPQLPILFRHTRPKQQHQVGQTFGSATLVYLCADTTTSTCRKRLDTLYPRSCLSSLYNTNVRATWYQLVRKRLRVCLNPFAPNTLVAIPSGGSIKASDGHKDGRIVIHRLAVHYRCPVDEHHLHVDQPGSEISDIREALSANYAIDVDLHVTSTCSKQCTSLLHKIGPVRRRA